MAHVPKYILAKANRLNKMPKDSEKLAKEITHWLMLSGVPCADIKPYNRLVEALKNGQFKSEQHIQEGFNELMDYFTN